MNVPTQLFLPTKTEWTYFHENDTEVDRFRKVLNIAYIWRRRRAYGKIRQATGLTNEEINLCVKVLEDYERHQKEQAL